MAPSPTTSSSLASGFRAERHHDPDRSRPSTRRRRHWKLKMWKRRTAERRAKAYIERATG